MRKAFTVGSVSCLFIFSICAMVSAQTPQFGSWGDSPCDWGQACFKCGDLPGWCDEELEGCVKPCDTNFHRGDNWWLNGTFEDPGDSCTEYMAPPSPPAQFNGLNWYPPASPLDKDNCYKAYINSPFQKRSLALAIKVQTVERGKNKGELRVYLNGGESPYQEPLAVIPLRSGEYPLSAISKEYLVCTTLDLSGISNPPDQDGNCCDYLYLRASGDVIIAMKRVLYGDYEFCTLQGTIVQDSGEPWSLRTGSLSISPTPASGRTAVPFYTELQHPNYLDFDDVEEYRTTPYEYCITGFEADTYVVSADIFGHNHEPLTIKFLPGELVRQDLQITPNEWSRPLGVVRRPNRSIPVIVEKPDNKASTTFAIELELLSPGMRNIAASLESDFVKAVDAQLDIEDITWGDVIYNNTRYGCRVLASLPGRVNIPEDLYDLVVSYGDRGSRSSEVTVNCVKLVKSLFYSEDEEYYFVHITDAHFSHQQPQTTISDLMDDWRVINPAFVISSGDNWEGGQGWALQSMAWLEASRDSSVPLYMGMGNHDYNVERNTGAGWLNLRQFIRDGWDMYHGQRLYEFAYGPDHHYFSADDNLYDEEAQMVSCDTPGVGGNIHQDDINWLSGRFNEIAARAAFVGTFSHQFGRCERDQGTPEMGCDNCNDQVPPTCCNCPEEDFCAWYEVERFDDVDNIVDLQMSGHQHHNHCYQPMIDEPGSNEWTGARMDNYGGPYPMRTYGVHYIKNDALDKTRDNYVDNWVGGCPGGPSFPLVNDVSISDPRYGMNSQTVDITNYSDWDFPNGRARFTVGNLSGTESWSCVGGTVFNVYYYTNGAGVLCAVVDCRVDIQPNMYAGNPLQVILSWH